MQDQEQKSENKLKNIMINDFFIKLKDQISAFSERLKSDKQLLLITGCVVVLFITGILMIIFNGSQPDTAAGSIPALSEDRRSGKAADTIEIAEVLPQQRRNDGSMQEGTWIPVSPYIDPFADPIKLTGIATGGAGWSMAIIESGGSSYIVSVGDYVDDLWAVLDIKSEQVILRAYNQEITLFLDQPPLTRTLNEDVGEEGQEGS